MNLCQLSLMKLRADRYMISRPQVERWFILVTLCILGLPAIFTMQQPAVRGPVDTPVGRLATANTAFAYNLYTKLGSLDLNRNLFFSPGSISVAMAMTYLGARGNTATEMKNVLMFGDISESELHTSFSELLKVYKNTKNVTLHMANRLYADQRFNILESYLTDSKQHYEAELAKVNFAAEFEAARQMINLWVEEQTAQRIKDMLPSGSLNADTRAVLVNAVYFKGDWDSKFKTEKTEPGMFTTADDEKIPVKMMYQKGKFFFGSNPKLEAQAIELPYAGQSMSMIIVLPEAGKFTNFEKNFIVDDIINCEKSFRMGKRDVHLWLPRFKMEESFSLGEHLVSLGMRDLFDQAKANLSGLDKDNSIFVSKVLHKAFLEVNEEGTEAAAATAVVMMLRMAVKEIHFKADHPFLFFIRENTTRSILFMGRLMKPLAETTKDEL